MIDQVSDLKSRGVQAAILSGNRDVDPKFIATESHIQVGKFSHLYSYPEAIDRWRQMLLKAPLSEQVVACISGKVLSKLGGYLKRNFVYLTSCGVEGLGIEAVISLVNAVGKAVGKKNSERHDIRGLSLMLCHCQGY